MHLPKLGFRVGLLAAVGAVIVAFVAFAAQADANAGGRNLDGEAGVSQFRIPGTLITRTTGAVLAGTAAPFGLTVTDSSIFPATGQIIVTDGVFGDGDKDNAEVMTYNSTAGNTFNITERGATKIPGSVNKAHPAGSLVKIATVTTGAVTGANGAQSNLTAPATIAATAGGCVLVPGETFATCPADPAPLPAPFMITLTSTASFPATGCITVGHQDWQTSNQGGVGPGQSNEYMCYDSVGVGANQLRITERAQQPSNRAYPHRANGAAQPSGNTGRTKVDLHWQLNVKSNVGFFPAGNLMVCDATNPLTNCELMGHNNAASKIKAPAATEFHITGRCEAASTNAKQPNTCPPFPSHAAGSVVTGADAFLTCRNRSNEPGVDTDLGTAGIQEPVSQAPAGSSVGLGAACQTQTQPKGGAKPTCCPITSQVELVGQDLIVINSIAGQPFLSTGCFTHVVLGVVPCVDTNGPTDGTLNLTSPCITDFTPGTNLLVTVTFKVGNAPGVDTGTIRVVLDTIHDAIDGNADDCDDPSGQDTFNSTNYDTIASAEDAADDTDNDGCLDVRELSSSQTTGGLRDPWNPYDYYDINHDGAVSVPVDIVGVSSAFGLVPPNDRRDRGALNYGPFTWNKSAPDGAVAVGADINGVAGQFGVACPHTHALYVGANQPWYGAGVVSGH